MSFADNIEQSLLRIDFSASGKDDALRKIAAIAAASPRLAAFGPQRIHDLLAEREAAVSTGLGNGVAIPHARIEGLEDLVVFALVAPRGVDFEALDKRRVQLFFVVFAPTDKVNEHLKCLATISRIVARSGVRRELLLTTSPAVLHEVIARIADEGERREQPPDERLRLLLAILYYDEDLHALLEYLIDQGIQGATVIDSKGMGTYVSAMPLFASFLGFMREDRNTSSTVMTLIPASRERAIIEGIERITGDLDKKQGAMVITLDVAFNKGTMSMI